MPESLEIVPQKEPPQPAPQTPAPVAAAPELTAAEYMSGFVPSRHARFDSWPRPTPTRPATDLAQVDKSLQAPILTKLQQQRGNRHVQRLVRRPAVSPGAARAWQRRGRPDTALADRIAAGSQYRRPPTRSGAGRVGRQHAGGQSGRAYASTRRRG